MTHCFITYVAHGETWRFTYNPRDTVSLMMQLQKWADDPELAFDWIDVARVVAMAQGLQDVRPRRASLWDAVRTWWRKLLWKIWTRKDSYRVRRSPQGYAVHG